MLDGLTERITAAYAEEWAAPVPPRTRDDIPLSYDLIGPEWLTDVLCRDVAGAHVVGVTLGPPDEGTNNRRRIFLEYDAAGEDAGLPRSVFCKATQGLANRLMLGHSGGIVCEVTFHQAARRLLPIEAPTAWLAAYDPVSFKSIVVFDDLAGRAEFCSEETVVDRGFVESQLDLLATVHARFHAAPELTTTLAALPTWYRRFHNLAGFHLAASCAAGVDAAEAILPASLFARREAIWPATLRSLELLRELPPTLCHGDVHLKNWYRCHDGTVGLADWGVAHIGHWSRDVIYTIATALDVADRRRWENELVAFYLDRLAAKGGPRVGQADAMAACRWSLPTAFAFWTLTLKPTPDFPDMQPEATARVFVERLGTAMADHEALDV